MRQTMPAVICRKKRKTQIVHFRIQTPGFQRFGVASGMLQPELALGGLSLAVLVEHPHHSWEEAVAPVGPGLALMLPPAILGVQRIKIRMFFHQFPCLLLCKLESLFENIPDIAR